MAMRFFLVAACAFLCHAEYPPPKIQACTNYFGEDTNDEDEVVSVVDIDVPSMFCDGADKSAPCTFVHKSGPGSDCAPPTPPDKCHHYMKVTYSKCDALDKGLVGGIDTEDVFDTSDGVLKECKDHVKKKEVVCWGPKKGEAISELPFHDSYDVEECDCEDHAEYPPPKIQACTNYFGEDTNDEDEVVSVVDLDVPSMFCDGADKSAPCTFVHKSGPGSDCAPPTPPDTCHRYMKVTYSKCDALDKGLVGGIDTDDVFDTSDGVLKECKDHVKKKEVVCWGPKEGEAISETPFRNSYDVEECDCKDLISEYEYASSITAKVGDRSLPLYMLVAAVGFLVTGSMASAVKRQRERTVCLSSDAGDTQELERNFCESLE